MPAPGVGTLGAANPWEFLHKARFGQPGFKPMPALVEARMTTQDYADLLAYVQTLPTESPVTEGGRLYDKWWAALGLDKPATDQPLWKTQTTNTRTGRWLCAPAVVEITIAAAARIHRVRLICIPP